MNRRPLRSPRARNALRAATRDIHERLHVSPSFLAIAEGRLNRRGYGDLMQRLAGIYFSLAPELAIEPARMQRLARDLTDLGMRPPAACAWSAPEGAARKLGWQYVVEGSIFGGQVIYRQLDYLLGDAEEGRRFFAGSPEGARRWRGLCEEFERVGAEERNLAEMVAGSCEAFAHFEGRLMAEPVHG